MTRNHLIDRRKRKRAAQREETTLRHEDYKRIVEKAADCIFVIDKKYKVQFANEAAATFLGKTRKDVEGRSIFAIFPKTLGTAFSEQLDEVFKTGEGKFDTGFRVIVAGKERWIGTRLDPILNKDDSVSAVLGVSRDITERKRLEERLGSLHQHSLKLASANEMDQIVKYTIDTMRFTLGFAAADFDMVEDGLLVPKAAKGEEAFAIPLNGPGLEAKAARDKKSIRVGDTRKDANYMDRNGPDWQGPETMLSEMATPVIIDGHTVAVLNVEHCQPDAFSEQDQTLLENLAAHVASEIKRLEHERQLENYSKELRRSSQFLESIIENANVWLNVLDEEENVLVWNNAAETLSGYSREEVVGHSKIWEWLYPDEEYRNQITESVTDVLRHGKVEEDLETNVKRKDGEIRVISWNERNLLGEHGKVIGSVAIGRDVTAQKRMQEELKRYSTSLEQMVAERTSKLAESEKRFRELANLLPQIVFETDAKGNYTFVNRSGIAASGYAEEEVYSGLNAVQTFVEGDREDIRKSIGRILAGNDGRRHEFTALRKDGTTFPVMLISRPITRESKAVGIRGIAVDITELKETQNELRTARERLERIIRSNPAAIYSGKPLPDYSDWFLTYISDRITEMIGFEPKQFSDLNFWRSRIHPDDRAQTQAAMSQIFKRGTISVDYRFLCSDAAYRWIREEAKVNYDSSGKPIEVYGYLTDITELKRSDQAVRESEARYRRFFESSPVSLWEEDFSEVAKYFTDLKGRGIRNLRDYLSEHPEELTACASMVRVVDVNEATLQLYGARSVGEIRGELRRIFTHEFQQNFVEELVAFWDGKLRFTSEFDNQTLKGEVRHVNLILNVVPGYETTLAKVLVSVIDLTERKQIEQRLQQAERLAAVGETAAMVGHDLRNPMQGIAGALHLLKQADLTPDERTEMLDLIQKNLEYSDGIIRDLVEYSAKIQLRIAETTPKSIIQTALQSVNMPENIALQNLSEDEPKISVDSGRMKRVLTNILQNAVDAMPNGGTLRIESRRVNAEFEIEFADTGSGMPREIMKNLWTPLHTTKAKGLGLGLAICKRIVEAHGGYITVKDRVGGGTSITLRMPICMNVVEVKQK
jgi:PAS domain S-box-containing protein